MNAQHLIPAGDAESAGKGRGGTELLSLVVAAAVVFAFVHLAAAWHPSHHRAAIDLSLSALPGYAARSLARVLAAGGLALACALGLAYWGVRDPLAERFVLPLVDHTRRLLPATGLLPLLAMGLVAVLPYGTVGLEITALLVLTLCQMGPMISGLRSAVKSVPPPLREMARVYQFSPARRFRTVELPWGTPGLVWNAMTGMARAWFLLIAAETLVQGTRDLRLPGLGAFLDEAVRRGDRPGAVGAALAAMAGVIVGLYALVWRPLLVWAQKFRPDEEGTAYPETPPLTWLWRSRPVRALERLRRGARDWIVSCLRKAADVLGRLPLPGRGRLSVVVLVLIAGPLAYGALRLLLLLRDVSPAQWADLLLGTAVTVGRVLLTLALATLWALPAGLAVGLSPRLARWGQPIALVLASFPATLLFPPVLASFESRGWPLGWACVVLMLLAAQWYVLFNVLAGAAAVPAELREAVRCFRLPRWRRFRTFQVPAVFPALVAGWDAAANLAWSTSLIAEAVTRDGHLLPLHGLGYEITRATQGRQYGVAAAGLLILAGVLELFARLVWRPLHARARQRYAFGR